MPSRSSRPSKTRTNPNREKAPPTAELFLFSVGYANAAAICVTSSELPKSSGHRHVDQYNVVAMSEVSAQYEIRSFRPQDAAACRRLYTEGLLSKSIAPNDTGWDIDNIEQVYMRTTSSHFWVATTPEGEVVGMMGVQHHEPGVGEIRRLRVAKEHRRRGIGSALLETALRFCQQRGDVKVALDTMMDREQALAMFERFHFRHHGSKQLGERELLYFYADLYTQERRRE